MELSVDVRIPFAPSIVFAACRDNMQNLVPYLPRIRSIEVTQRSEHGPVVENVVEWRAGADVPAPLRAMFMESMYSWTDYATWNAETLSCDWRSESRAFMGAMRCGAHDTFLEDGPGKTLLEIRGAVDVDPQRLRGIPGLFAEKLARKMEAYVVGKIKTDMIKTSEGLTRYLTEGQ